ncbi:hypothetical protein OH77DRAFT_1592537 [Trametes cingulata]|nr:hypothetical protein OH77DRAFT_1592537 [Trametes cingulata]
MADNSGPAETRLELCTCESECGPSGRMIPAYEIRNHRRRDDRRQTTTFRRARGLRVASAKVLGTGRGVMNTTARVAPSRAPLHGDLPSVARVRVLGEHAEEAASDNKRNRTNSISGIDPPEAQRMRMSVTPEPHEQSAGSSRPALETSNIGKADNTGHTRDDPHDIEDLYYNPPPSPTSWRQSPPQSSNDYGAVTPRASPEPSAAPLGLYDDPDDLDEVQYRLDHEGGEPGIDSEPALAVAGEQSAEVAPALLERHAPPQTAPTSTDGQAEEGHGQGVPSASSVALPRPAPLPERRSSSPAAGGLELLPVHPLYAVLSALPPLPARRADKDIHAASHEKWYVRVILMAVAYLHTTHHVTFRAANIVLFTIRTIFVALRLLDIGDAMPTTLTTTLRRLDLTDKFHVLPVCAKCRRLFRPDIDTSARCPECKNSLFKRGLLNIVVSTLRKLPLRMVPHLAAPFRPLSASLIQFLARPDSEKLVDQWRADPTVQGVYRRIQDGRIWQTVKGSDGLPFFGPQEHGELRIGVVYHLDWFSCRRSPYAPSHSSGALSFSIANLEQLLRYRLENMLPTAMTPGPTEPDAEELQYYQELVVDDLLVLYHEGVLAPTRRHPQGIRSRVVCICASLDHPGMCKSGGFADKNHAEQPCPKCMAKLTELYMWFRVDAELEHGALPLRDDQRRHALAKEWRSLETDDERRTHFKTFGTRWTAFSRLPYFDVTRMMVIDPMHNLLLGIVKTQWYSRWIKGSALRADTETGNRRELSVLHDFLESFEIPAWVGRLPSRVGEPAGGSLSADEYKSLFTGPCVLVIPIIWDRFLDAATEEHQRALRRYEKARTAWEKSANAVHKAAQARASTGADVKPSAKKDDTLPPAPSVPVPRMQAEEVDLFLKLATALKLILASSGTDASYHRGCGLLNKYLRDYQALYGEDKMVPNHHFALHTEPQLFDYGTVYDIWAFLAERLNKLFKDFNLNNWGGGQLEITMMRAFYRNVDVQMLIQHMATEAGTDALDASQAIAKYLLKDSREARGTVEATAQQNESQTVRVSAHGSDEETPARTALNIGEDELRNQLQPSSRRVVPGPARGKPVPLSDAFTMSLVSYYNAHPPCAVVQDPDSPRSTSRSRQRPPHVYHFHDPAAPPGSMFLEPACTPLSYILVDGHRITPHATSSSGKSTSAVVKVLHQGASFCGEVMRAFSHVQPGFPAAQVFVEMLYMVPAPPGVSPVRGNPWEPYPELEVKFWLYRKHHDTKSPLIPPPILPASSIVCQLARGAAPGTTPPIWMTTTLERHAASMEPPREDEAP